MKYICVFRDVCGVVQAFDFLAENDKDAITGLLDKCRAQIQVSEGARIDRLHVLPEVLIREDMKFSQLNLRRDERGEEFIENLGTMDID